jgi:DNA-binding NarL/FixJ family response regulator
MPSAALDAGALWESVRTREELVTASFCTETECHLELTRNPMPSLLDERSSNAVDLLLRGESQKFIAFEMARSPSTIALRLRRALESMGLRGGPRTIPAAVINIAQAAWGTVPELVGRIVPVTGKPNRRLISIRRPNPRTFQRLSPAEVEVVDLLIEGKTREQIAQLRRTAKRTLANQLAEVYKKLQVTGRIPLLIRTIEANAYVAVQPEVLAPWLEVCSA